MIIILGLIILIAAVIAGTAGVLGSTGSGHALSHPFTVLGYHVTGSGGRVFGYGLAVGALAMLGLSLLLAGAWRASRRGQHARQGLRQSRREALAITHGRQTNEHHQEDRAQGRNGQGERQEDRRPGHRQPAPAGPRAAVNRSRATSSRQWRRSGTP
jgi:hypothetical protein